MFFVFSGVNCNHRQAVVGNNACNFGKNTHFIFQNDLQGCGKTVRSRIGIYPICFYETFYFQIFQRVAIFTMNTYASAAANITDYFIARYRRTTTAEPDGKVIVTLYFYVALFANPTEFVGILRFNHHLRQIACARNEFRHNLIYRQRAIAYCGKNFIDSVVLVSHAKLVDSVVCQQLR